MQRDGSVPFITSDTAHRLLANTTLPSPAEQADNLVLWLATEVGHLDAGKRIQMNALRTAAEIGAGDEKGAAFVVESLLDQRMLDAGGAFSGPFSNPLRLSFAGWERAAVLQRATVDSRVAFMAMPFGNASVDLAYRDCFQPAVAAAGFELRTVVDPPRAGLIDTAMEVAIHRAAFIVADLTGGNLGVYWEAGMARGLRKPVFYTCEQRFFDTERTHFDLNHHHTVKWDPNDLSIAQRDLTVVIRATLPTLARLGDD